MSKQVKIEVHAPGRNALNGQFLIVRVENSVEYSVGSYISKDNLRDLTECDGVTVTQTGVWGSR